ncbi:glucoamylase family protein [Allosphingosinicella vermicomposti]|uniref:glucoamylase family protein n=1 Tax=Allosphingosinicella vermicomposti TaxID=614671 RepID=UPI000D10A17A|nr:glucoamylase family protein [Allosphingosinicella vermicomposti]
MRLKLPRAVALLLTACVLAACQTAAPNSPGKGQAPAGHFANAKEAAFAEDLSRRTFQYFWDTTTADTCLAPDRWPSNPFSSIAATGFALTAYPIGVERGYITRAQAAERTLKCVQYYHDLPQGPDVTGVSGHKGFFYHFLRNDNGHRFGSTELSTVDTSLLLGGILFAQAYFDRDDPRERRIRDLAEAIYRRVDWTFVQRNRTGTQAANLPNSHGITMGWKPERGFETHDWVGYNEGMLVYILAAASPTHPVGRDAWDKGWAADLEKDWGTFYGQEHLQFEPLFGHQYSHVWVDFRGIQDEYMRGKGIDYFENSRRAVLSQRAYGAANPNKWVGYSGDIWGWTASDGPGGIEGKTVNGIERRFMGYSARGASAVRVVDDGTIVPTAAGGSIPFAPEVTLPALLNMKAAYGDKLYSRYGFRDSFNPSFTFADAHSTDGKVYPGFGWIANDHLGIDQGPILAMLENHRSELVWKTMRKSPHIRNGLKKLGFSGGWLEE